MPAPAVSAATAALLAALAVTVAAGFLARKRLAWETCFDMPVGLATPYAAGTSMAVQILLGEPGTEQGWLVFLCITNPGHTRVRGTDFSAPLSFSFPGQRVHAARILPEPAGPTAQRTALKPTIRLSPGSTQEPDYAARMHLTGDYVLRPGDSYTIMLVLSGTPAARGPRMQPEGALAAGKIIPGKDTVVGGVLGSSALMTLVDAPTGRSAAQRGVRDGAGVGARATVSR
jgi:hypothetical protein